MSLIMGPNMGLLIDAAAGDAHPNEMRKLLRALDCFLGGLSVKSRSISVQPASPADGDRYILPAGASGAAWAGRIAGTVAYYTTHLTVTSGGTETTTSAWEFYTPKRNWNARIEDESDVQLHWSGTAWV